ncbi:MAG: glycosyltransferase [Firmicutes bacterium HGW-Firmicutes-14]|jgi:N-acetylglucosaminyldiphosphoundecaprenol N-acetyl-beta-D-mannosaminyltransferase|nr:MAG: glycosyltransferase [Firmicutes bacterium HGW-Firmicutes-14]
MERVNILGVEIDNLDLEGALARIDRFIAEGKPRLVVTANPEMIMLAGKDRTFRECFRQAGMVTADGIGVVVAAKLLGMPLKQRVTGIDLVTELFRRAARKGYTLYFAGARPGIAEKAAENVRQGFPGIKITGTHHGYFQDDRDIIDDIMKKKPDILLAAMGMGRQEKWIMDRVIKTGVPVSIGVGGSFDILAGEARRAPAWMRKAGLEWFYRLINQPARFGRMLELPKFLGAVLACRQKLPEKK